MIAIGLISMPPMMSRLDMTRAIIVEKAIAVVDCQMESGKQQDMSRIYGYCVDYCVCATHRFISWCYK